MSKKQTPAQNSKSNFTNVAAPDKRELTVYNTGFAVIQEWREFDLKSAGANKVQLDGMPSTYQPNSLFLFEYKGEGELTVGDGSLRPANLTPQTLLTKSIGSQITVRLHSGSNKTSTITGKLLAANGNKLIVELGNGRTWMGDATDDMELPKLPDGLTNSSALVVDMDVTTAGVYQAKILYFASNLHWSAFHKAIYDEKKGVLTRFDSQVGVTNHSGTVFGDSTLKLLAGNIGMQDAQESFALASAAPMGGGRSAKRAAAPQARFESVGEQKLYVIPRKVSLAEGENKEIPLFSAGDVPVEPEFYLPFGYFREGGPDDGQLESALLKLHAVNDAESKLGRPLPAGQVSIFQLDSDGSPQYIGPSALGHVADGERFELSLGASSDVKFERRLVSVHEDPEVETEDEAPRPVRPMGGPGVGKPRNPADLIASDEAAEEEGEEKEKPRFRTEVRQVTIHNFKADREVSVNHYDQFPAGHELTVEGEHKFEARGATNHVARLSVPAKGKLVLTYTLKFRIN